MDILLLLLALFPLALCSANNFPGVGANEIQTYSKISGSQASVDGVQETYKYYTVRIDPTGSKLWVDLEKAPGASEHELISTTKRRALPLKLKFPFRFYGHPVQNVTVFRTNGFLHVGGYKDSVFLSVAQYIAPLMADFDSRHSDKSTLRYLSTEDQLTVEWNSVYLKEAVKLGPFSFQVSLHPDGTIVFVYKNLPVEIPSIPPNESFRNATVGLSDGFIREKNVLNQSALFRYNRIELKSKRLRSGTAVTFFPVLTCNTFKSCSSCLLHETKFKCTWCSAANRCSDGTDRHRQDWKEKGCYQTNSTTPDEVCRGDEVPKYYSFTLSPIGPSLSVDLDTAPSTPSIVKVLTEETATLQLGFWLPFYGHLVRNVRISRDGFISLGEQDGAWSGVSQYIAPLKANVGFWSNTSSVFYQSTRNHLLVEWNNVFSQSPTAGPSKFQATLHKDGTIVFSYINIPSDGAIKYDDNSKGPSFIVGLSDVMVPKSKVKVLRQTILYEASDNSAKLSEKGIGSEKVVIFTPLDSCLSIREQNECKMESSNGFECIWCESVRRCYDALDRYRSDWRSNGCELR